MSQSSSNYPAPTGGDFILYGTEDGRTRIEVRFSGETVWLSLNQMADLFQRDKSVISKHIKNVFEEGELKPDSVVANFATTATDGKTYQVDFYNLDVIISVGYRVKSHRGTQFSDGNNARRSVDFPVCRAPKIRWTYGCVSFSRKISAYQRSNISHFIYRR